MYSFQVDGILAQLCPLCVPGKEHDLERAFERYQKLLDLYQVSLCFKLASYAWKVFLRWFIVICVLQLFHCRSSLLFSIDLFLHFYPHSSPMLTYPRRTKQSQSYSNFLTQAMASENQLIYGASCATIFLLAFQKLEENINKSISRLNRQSSVAMSFAYHLTKVNIFNRKLWF